MSIIERLRTKGQIEIDGDLAVIKLGDKYDWQDYQDFINLRASLPRYQFKYNEDLPILTTDKVNLDLFDQEVDPSSMAGHLHDYQEYYTKHIAKVKKFAIFWDCGLGKTSLELEIADQMKKANKRTLIVCPLLVLTQFQLEDSKFFPNLNIHSLRDSSLDEWKMSSDLVGIVNFEFFKEERDLSGVDCIILDESSILKSENGVFGKNIISSTIAAGIPYRIPASATPSPNDWGELANHALFLGQVNTYKEFFGDFFQKDLKNNNKWVLRPHAEKKFYDWLSTWSCLMRHPQSYGFKDNIKPVPDFEIIEKELDLTKEQEDFVIKKFHDSDQMTFMPVAPTDKGIVNRNKMAQISRGFYYDKKTSVRLESNKPECAFNLAYEKHPNEPIIIWVNFNEEEEILKEYFGAKIDLESISGSTKEKDRQPIIDRFLSGETRVLIAKPEMLGLGLNFQHCACQIFYGISDSFEKFYQAVRRSYRYGQERNLKVYIPFTRLEQEIMGNVLSKSDRWEELIERQEKLYQGAMK
jgi:SNF2 family DNA or RNA helicase